VGERTVTAFVDASMLLLLLLSLLLLLQPSASIAICQTAHRCCGAPRVCAPVMIMTQRARSSADADGASSPTVWRR
jgi:predicted MFS family arabinose efflux permease